MLKENINVMDLFESDRAAEFHYEKVEGGVRVVSYAGAKNFVKIPESIDGNPVVEIGEYNGGNISSLHPAILLPKTISRFNPDAFHQTTSDLWMGDIYICEDNPFFRMEDGILYSADMKVLYFCFNKTISELKMPDTVEIVKKGAFRAVTNNYILENITWSENLRVIEDYAFYNLYRNGRGGINLPPNVKSLGLFAFNNSIEIILNGEIEHLAGRPAGEYNINNDSYITDNRFLYSADKRTAIGYCMKTSISGDNILSVKELAFDSQTDTILPYAFYNFNKLEKLDLGSTVKSIGSCAFKKAIIKTIRIPAQVEEIADDAFGYDRCTSIIVNKDNKHFLSDKVCLYRLNPDGTKTLMKCFKDATEEYVVLDGTRDICVNAFSKCGSLRTLILPDSLQSFDGNCIRYTFVKSLVIPNRVQSLTNMAKIEYSLAEDNPYLVFEGEVLYQRNEKGLIAVDATMKADAIAIKEGTVEIADYAFAGFSNITAVTLPDSLIRIGHDAFSKCSIKQIVFNSGLKVIDDCAFESCQIETVDLPKSIEYVCRTAFTGCPVSEYKIDNQYYHCEDGVLYSADKTIMYAFPAKKNIDAFAVPEGVKHIGQAFVGSIFKKLSLPESVETFGERSLECDATDITFGKNISYISERRCLAQYAWNLEGKNYTFHGYQDAVLQDFVTFIRMTFKKTTVEVDFFGLEEFSDLSDDFEVLPKEDGIIITKVKTGDPDLVIPESIGDYPVVEVADVALKGKDLKSLTVKSARTIINYGVLHSLERAVLPEGQEEIPDEAFKSSTISSISIPNSIEKIGNNAFEYCDKLETVVIPGSVKTISSKMFAYCRRLRTVVIDEGVEEICNGAFFGCESLEKLVLPASISKIDDELFRDGNYKDLLLNPKTIYITVPGTYADAFLRAYKPSKFGMDGLKVVYSEEEIYNSFLYEPNGADTARVILKYRVDNEEPDVIIPEKIGEKTVTELNIAQSGNLRKDIESLQIPSSVESITEIEPNLFNTSRDGSAFRSIAVAEKNAHYWSDGKALYTKDRTKLVHLFAYDLTEYEVPDGVQMICKGAFAYQKKLTRITLPGTIEKIGEQAFSNCISLSEIVGADKVKSVAVDAYEATPYLENMPILILGDVFKSCKVTDKTVIRVPEGIREIAPNAFACPDSIIERIELPTTLRTIGRNAFGRLQHLTEIQIPNGVEEIVDGLFLWLEGLKKIDLPASVTRIGNDVFPKSLESIHVDQNNSVYASKDGILYTKDMTALIKVPCAYHEEKITLPNTVTTIEKGAFSGNKIITEVVLPESVNEIGSSAFERCDSLEKINLADVKTIQYAAFNWCKALKEITLSSNVISKNAFSNCYGLVTVNMRNTEEIEESAFNSCKLTSITFPASLRKIGKSAFDGCHFETVYIPQTVQEVGNNAFSGAKQITIFDSLQTNPGRIGSRDYGVPYHVINILSSETSLPKYSVYMDSDGSGDYNRVLSWSWGPNCSFDFKKIDSYFSKLKGADVKLRTCINRLKDPIDMSDSAKDMYIAYAARNAKAVMMQFIDENDIDSFVRFESFGTIKKANIDGFIEYATEKQAVTILAFLMDYKEKNLASKKSVKNTFSLGSPHLVSPWQISKNAISLVDRYKGADIEVVFPTEIDGKPIIGIANDITTVPDNYKSIVSVVIPEGYVTVGDNAFLGCENLERIVLPSTIERIGKSAFANCRKLKEIILPDSVVKIGDKCFQGCSSLEKVVLSQSLIGLGENTFTGCSALMSIDIPKSVRYMTSNLFSNAGIKTIIIHNQDLRWISNTDYGKNVSLIMAK